VTEAGAGPAIPTRLVLCLGLSQLVAWGVTYYLVGVLGPRIGADLGLPPTLVYGGFSLALVVMGLASPAVGRGVERRGGRPVMATGSLIAALGLAALAAARGPVLYLAAWLAIGLSMRMILYDAAFAALARIGGRRARRPIAQITLLGGLASTAFWPAGDALADAFGWRGAVLAYAGFALLTLPLHLAIPDARPAGPLPGAAPEPAPLASAGRDQRVAAVLYAVIVAGTSVLNSGMSAHMIPILVGLGAGLQGAVWIGTMRGVGQSGARLGEVLFGRNLGPLALCLGSTALLPPAFVLGLWGGVSPAAGLVFAVLYGVGNGLTTIVRGTLPLALFDPGTYGGLVGRLIAPSFYAAALAPLAYAAVIERFGPAAALHLSTALALVVAGAALELRRRFG
jgi:MFS family permease